MEFVPLLAALALAWKIVDFVKYARARDMDGIVGQGAIWVSGVLVAFLLAATDFAGGIEVGGKVLGDLNAFSLVLIGLTIGSTGAVGYDFKRAFDKTDSAATPGLVSGRRGLER